MKNARFSTGTRAKHTSHPSIKAKASQPTRHKKPEYDDDESENNDEEGESDDDIPDQDDLVDSEEDEFADGPRAAQWVDEDEIDAMHDESDEEQVDENDEATQVVCLHRLLHSCQTWVIT